MLKVEIATVVNEVVGKGASTDRLIDLLAEMAERIAELEKALKGKQKK